MEIVEGTLLRVFVSEKDRHEGIPLSEWILRKAKDSGIAGGTVFRGVSGFGAHHRIHSTRVIALSDDLPMVVEISDTTEKIEQFLPILDSVMTEGMSTTEKIQMRQYK